MAARPRAIVVGGGLAGLMTIIKLSDIGAVPGNTLKIARVGTYNDAYEFIRRGHEDWVKAFSRPTASLRSAKWSMASPGTSFGKARPKSISVM